MQEVISSLRHLPESSTIHYNTHDNNTTSHIHTNLELELTEAAPVSVKAGGGGDEANASNQLNGSAGMMKLDAGSPSTEAVKGIKRVRETPQWPSESAILVAG